MDLIQPIIPCGPDGSEQFSRAEGVLTGLSVLSVVKGYDMTHQCFDIAPHHSGHTDMPVIHEFHHTAENIVTIFIIPTATVECELGYHFVDGLDTNHRQCILQSQV